ncbi:hypothetical protein F5Y12DRAFT_383087 [Xylaria sp. FL1777]|nr:hypothetical protein F5Y12DRAFT_383087 [Xylaria sp. FL1777]
MSASIPIRLRSYLSRKLEKSRRRRAHLSTNTDVPERGHLGSPTTPSITTKPDVPTPKTIFDEQINCPFFQKLPLEIRKMIYAYVWQGPYDHIYHESNGRHLHFKDGRWVHTRCVMYREDDEDTDIIQKQMDLIHDTGMGDLLLWQRRLASTWGQRHWRCAERIEYGKPTSIDRTDLGALMVACKKMHPEVMESFLEYHKIIFNDIFSAHRFLVRPGSSRLVRHIRKLDLTFSLSFHEFTPFITVTCCPDTDEHIDVTEKRASLARTKNNLLAAIFTAIADHTTCLHSLRVSLDVYDRGPWRKIPERALASHLERISVQKGKKGEVNYTVELPPALPIRTNYTGLQELETESRGVGKSDEKRVAPPLPFNITRRPPLRYWQFNPGEVEHFTWETCEGERRHQHCWIALSKTTRLISNPYLIDFA